MSDRVWADDGDGSSTDESSLEQVLVAVAAGVAAVAGSYAMAGWTPNFAVVPIDQTVVWMTPGRVIAWSITRLGESGHLLHVALAMALTVGLYAAVVGLSQAVGRRAGYDWLGLVLGGAGVWVATVALVGEVVYGLLPALASVVVMAFATHDRSSVVSDSRRRVVRAAAGALPAIGLGVVLGRRQGQAPTPEPKNLEGDDGVSGQVDSLLQEAGDKTLDVSGMEPLVSQKFYTVDIASTNPRIDKSSWSLKVTGAVENEAEYSYQDLVERTTEHRFVTLRCVGDPLNGKKMDNALWTGVPVNELLDEAVPKGGCECVMLRADDGYYEEFPLEALRGGLLAYAMNGEALPRSHGYPLRALVPGHWGEVNVKWLTEIEILDEEAKGFWEKRGWHGTGPVNAVAKIHAVDRKGDGTVEVAGHAYAGTRGVSAVQVSTDGGSSWSQATLSDPLPGDDVWRQWRYEFSLDSKTEVVARMVDGDGTVQPRNRSKAYPSGATGWVSKTIEP